MPSRSEIIRDKGQVVLNETLPSLDNPIWDALNRQQRLMVRGWLGKGRVSSLEEALDKIQKRIEQDNLQGVRNDQDPISKNLDPI